MELVQREIVGESVRGQHKRIFGGQRQPNKANNRVDLPYCFFHKENKITKFCECRNI
jgi:hypothetical protein